MAILLGIIIGILLTAPLTWYIARKRTERRVHAFAQRAQAAERLAELGTMTGGLAHEIKNPLSIVGLNVQLLQEDLDELSEQVQEQHELAEHTGRVKRRIDALGHEIARLREILEDFLRFAGRMKLDFQPTDINGLVSEMVDFFAPQAAAANVNLRTQLAASPSQAPVDIGLLKQALLNLLINATHAMLHAREKKVPHGGSSELIIRTENLRNEIAIHITDTGPGIDAQTLAKIFQPYFSTRRGGTGLGLPITRRIIEEHKGIIRCHSEVGRGTDFTIILQT